MDIIFNEASDIIIDFFLQEFRKHDPEQYQGLTDYQITQQIVHEALCEKYTTYRLEQGKG